MEQSLRACAPRVASGRGGIGKELLKEAKRLEFPDEVIARLTGLTERQVHDLRMVYGITASYKMVDTCAAEFAAETPYYYSVFGSENEVEETSGKKKVLVLGSGPIRIGQGNVITFGGRVSCGVTIGNFNLMNGCVSLGHDVTIGDCNVMQPEVRISGETNVGNANFLGVRCTVLQGLTIGNSVRIGTGSVVMRKTKDGMSYFGNPAKMIRIQ